jgi:hypothetical protein
MENGFGVITDTCILRGAGFGLVIPGQDGFQAIGNFIGAEVDGFGFPATGTEDNFSLTFQNYHWH